MRGQSAGELLRISLRGSVATILTKDARRWWVGSDRSCGPVEQVGDKGGLAADIMTVNLSNLSLPHHRHGLETRQGVVTPTWIGATRGLEGPLNFRPRWRLATSGTLRLG